jgi:hypothetical protein
VEGFALGRVPDWFCPIGPCYSAVKVRTGRECHHQAASGSAQVSAGASIYIDRLCGCEAWLACGPQRHGRVSVPLRKGLRVPLRVSQID